MPGSGSSRAQLFCAIVSALTARCVGEQNCSDYDVTGCKPLDHCMWHYGGCRRRPSKPANLHCMDGGNFTDCFDIATCASKSASAPTPEAKWAFVITHSAPQDFHTLPLMNLEPLVKFAKETGNMDVVLILPKEGKRIDGLGGEHAPLADEAKIRLAWLGIKIHEVPWAIPPGMQYLPGDDWCGPQDFIRLHVYGLEGYSAVVYIDNDVQFTGHPDVKLLFQCAAQDYMLMTGDVIGPVNIGVFAVKPSSGLKQTSIIFAQSSDYNRMTGWSGAGFGPFNGPYVGGDCGQGFSHTLFFKQDFHPIQLAAQQAGATLPAARQIDLCKWNYMHGWECPVDYPCENVVFLHKSSYDKGGCKQKQRYGFYIHTRPNATAAVMEQLMQVRQYYPGANVYITSDGGLNLTKACFKITDRSGAQCHFSWWPHVNDTWNPKPFFDRFREAAAWLNSEYVVMLEPDVSFHSPISQLPVADAGGVRNVMAQRLSEPLQLRLEHLGREALTDPSFRLLWPYPGLTGGSIVRTSAALRSFRAESIDWKEMERLDGERVYSSEIAMIIALATHGHNYYPWDDVCTVSVSEVNSSALFSQTAFRAGNLSLYGKQLAAEDVNYVEEPRGGAFDVHCQHCENSTNLTISG